MAAARKVGLGRGLGALLPTDPAASQEAAKFVPITSVIPNPRQPRTDFNKDELQELSDSIKEHGVIQPLVVTDEENGIYTLITGERRLRASQLAGLATVPVIIRQATDREMLELALIENVQRADLSPLETAEAYRNLEENFNMTHEEIAKRVGKNRSSVTNTIRLLRLPDEAREALVNGKITEGHGRVLLSLPTPQSQIAAMQYVINNDLNVRQTEEYVRSLIGERSETKPKASRKALSPEMKQVEIRLRESFGTKVTLKESKTGSGSIQIHYYSPEELETLVNRFCGE